MQCKKPQQKNLIQARVIARQSWVKSQRQTILHFLLNFASFYHLAVFTSLKKQYRRENK
jgi:hypothetical protein